MSDNNDLLPQLVIRKVRNGFEVMPMYGGGTMVAIEQIRVFNELGRGYETGSLLHFLETLFSEDSRVCSDE